MKRCSLSKAVSRAIHLTAVERMEEYTLYKKVDGYRGGVDRQPEYSGSKLR